MKSDATFETEPLISGMGQIPSEETTPTAQNYNLRNGRKLILDVLNKTGGNKSKPRNCGITREGLGKNSCAWASTTKKLPDDGKTTFTGQNI
ncbi:MAG: hypothetical protein ACLR0N_10340 [Bilophila wadsworthia]